MKKFITSNFTKLTLILVMFIGFLQFSFTERMLAGVRFMNWSFDEVSHQAKVRNKPMFIFVYSNTCLQSKRMDDVFKMRQVSEFFNKNFVCNKYETEGFGHRIQAVKWGVKSYPSFVFFDRTGKIVHIEAGYKKHDDILAMGKDGLEKAILSAAGKATKNAKVSDADLEKESQEQEEK